MDLTKEQKYVIYNLVKNARSGTEIQTLGGYAGTGKTVVVRYLKHFLPNYAVAAYTGKAAAILRKKGVQATTIHSLIYHPLTDRHGNVHFVLVDKDNINCDGFIIDEASMVSEEIYEDLMSFGLPIIFVGDHGQLEPVNSDFNLMANPMYKLETIHRNAGEIAQFANILREGYPARSFKPKTGAVKLLWPNQVNNQLMNSEDQIICAFNKTRVEINNRIRAFRGYQNLIERGEKIICLRNNRQLALFNGMQGIVLDYYKERKKNFIDFQFEDFIYNKVSIDINQFGKETNEFEFSKDSPNPFDYAICITTHKSQGDEWDKVMVIEQRSKKWDHRRWAYTAASRAREHLDWVLG